MLSLSHLTSKWRCFGEDAILLLVMDTGINTRALTENNARFLEKRQFSCSSPLEEVLPFLHSLYCFRFYRVLRGADGGGRNWAPCEANYSSVKATQTRELLPNGTANHICRPRCVHNSIWGLRWESSVLLKGTDGGNHFLVSEAEDWVNCVILS